MTPVPATQKVRDKIRASRGLSPSPERFASLKHPFCISRRRRVVPSRSNCLTGPGNGPRPGHFPTCVPVARPDAGRAELSRTRGISYVLLLSGELMLSRVPDFRSAFLTRARRVLTGLQGTAERSHLALISAGVAFFGLMAFIPGLAALIAFVGIFGEPGWVGQQVRAFRGVAPDAVVSIIHGQVERLLEAADQPLLAGALFNLFLAIWSALQGTRWVLVALSAINTEAPPRSFLKRYVAAGQFTLFGLGLGALAIVLLGVAPVLLALFPLRADIETLLLVVRWPVLGSGAVGALLVFYRWGPAGPAPDWRFVWPGALLAPLVWLAASSLLTFGLREFPAFGAAYGTLASVVALLLWLYLSALIFLLGAAFNSELRRLSEDQGA